MDKKLTRRAILNAGAAAVSGSVLSAATVASASKRSRSPGHGKSSNRQTSRSGRINPPGQRWPACTAHLKQIIGTLSDKYGAPYNTFPMEATLYGSGGFGGLGSICGTINACGLLFGLFAKKQEDLFALCQEISLWYENAQLPAYKPRKPRLDIPMATSVSRSHLCHISSTTWANASGHQLLTQQHFERCNRLVADVAAQAVTMLNEYSAGTIAYNQKLNSFSQGCLSCHGPGKAKANVASGMTCNPCHTNPH